MFRLSDTAFKIGGYPVAESSLLHLAFLIPDGKAKTVEAAVAETILQSFIHLGGECGIVEPEVRFQCQVIQVTHLLAYFLLFVFVYLAYQRYQFEGFFKNKARQSR